MASSMRVPDILWDWLASHSAVSLRDVFREAGGCVVPTADCIARLESGLVVAKVLESVTGVGGRVDIIRKVRCMRYTSCALGGTSDRASDRAPGGVPMEIWS